VLLFIELLLFFLDLLAADNGALVKLGVLIADPTASNFAALLLLLFMVLKKFYSYYPSSFSSVDMLFKFLLSLTLC